MSGFPSDQPVLELTGATVSSSAVENVRLIEGIHWSVKAGEFWVIGGPPGAGKSVLMATSAGMLRPLQGQHRLFCQDTAGLAEDDFIRLRLRVGLVFEGGGRLFHELTVEENLALPLCYHRDCSLEGVRDRLSEVLALTELREWAKQRPRSLSRGISLRAALARALMLEPDLLILDNPLKGLDLPQTRWWLSFLAALQSRARPAPRLPMTLVVATDHFDPWLSLGNRFAVIANRQWKCLGDRAQFLACQEPVLREMMAAGWENSE